MKYTKIEVMSFILTSNKVDERMYIYREYDCKHFSRDLVQDLNNHFPGLEAKTIIVEGVKTKHAIVAFECKEGTILIEPQTDMQVTERYKDRKTHFVFDLYFSLWKFLSKIIK